MARERYELGGGVDLDAARLGVVDEDGLRVIQLGRHRLALFAGNGPAVEEDAERVASGAILANEDLHDRVLSRCHGLMIVNSLVIRDAQSTLRKRSISHGVTWTRYSSHSCRLISMKRLKVCSP